MKVFVLNIVASLLFFSIIYGEKYSNVRKYSGGRDKFKLNKILYNTDYNFILSGKSVYKYLYIKIDKINRNSMVSHTRKITVNLKQPDKFAVLYFFKDGTGKYRITIFGNNNPNLSFTGLCNFTVNVTNSISLQELNQLNINDKILKYVGTVIGKTVGRGECWDLTQAVLDNYNADWTRPFNFGVPINYKSKEVLPGDIVQMYKIKLKYDNKIEYYGYPNHTAIVYKVLSKNKFILAHQNVFNKRYVILTKFDVGNIVTGRLDFYRPIMGFVNITNTNQ